MRNLVLTNLGRFAAVTAAALLAIACAGGDATMPPSSAKIAPDVAAAAQAMLAGRDITPPARSNVAGRLQVYIYVATVSDATVADLGTHGLSDMVPSVSMSIVEGWARPQDLDTLAALSFVTRITLPHYARPY